MRVLVIIPTYNEIESLEEAVAGVLAHTGYGVLVVDDNSPDGTGALADRLAADNPGSVIVMHRTAARGLGRSYLDGFRHALETDAQLICQMDADLSHDPKYLPQMVAKAENHDLVLGSRYLQGVSVANWPLRRLILSIGANRYVRLITGMKVTDCTSGFRCWRREALAQIDLDAIKSHGYAFLTELLYRAHRLGLSIAEVPIIFVERREGRSKLSGGVFAEAVWTPWRLRFQGLLSGGGGKPRDADRHER
jgi:dolichol-phosphate mannosyltransferase